MAAQLLEVHLDDVDRDELGPVGFQNRRAVPSDSVFSAFHFKPA